MVLWRGPACDMLYSETSDPLRRFSMIRDNSGNAFRPLRESIGNNLPEKRRKPGGKRYFPGIDWFFYLWYVVCVETAIGSFFHFRTCADIFGRIRKDSEIRGYWKHVQQVLLLTWWTCDRNGYRTKNCRAFLQRPNLDKKEKLLKGMVNKEKKREGSVYWYGAWQGISLFWCFSEKHWMLINCATMRQDEPPLYAVWYSRKSRQNSSSLLTIIVNNIDR